LRIHGQGDDEEEEEEELGRRRRRRERETIVMVVGTDLMCGRRNRENVFYNREEAREVRREEFVTLMPLLRFSCCCGSRRTSFEWRGRVLALRVYSSSLPLLVPSLPTEE
jgi:hypothetical protein